MLPPVILCQFRKDGIDEATETTLGIYGCDLIQESGILLRLPQAVVATGQVLFHRFYCKKSFARFNVKKVAASSVWLASKLEENPRKASQATNRNGDTDNATCKSTRKPKLLH
ncbi:Cyclin-L1-1 [Lathyrus oleraceus]|uniref:B-like cyclin n=1 Tax=Pisum sativum TaxID=3888 RepID=A0A9D4X4Y4_PEA|nr:Cyclin-L1-1 [Pisum sativum]KAI5399872.1 Cyclin-L1-1 [Pisum sativum]KAI5412285.1 Cyclin-L1-1 [Pisum sativum]